MAKKSKLISTGALSRLLSPVRNYVIAGCVLAVLSAALGLVPYIAISEIARLIIKNTGVSYQTIWMWVFIAIIGTAVRLFFLFYSSKLGHIADAEILYKIRVDLVRHLGTIPLGWFKEKGSGAIKKVMTTDLEEMHQLIAHSLREMLAAITTVIVGLSYLFLINWQMTMVSITVLLIMFVSYKIAMRSATVHMDRLLDAEVKISTSAVEYADGITVVKTFGVGGRLLSRFDNAVKEYTNALRVWVLETQYSSAVSRLFASEVTLLGVLVITGLLLIGNGTLLVEDFLPFLIVGIGLPNTLVPAVHGSQGLRKGRLSASNIERILSLQTIDESKNPQKPKAFSICFDKVSFAYSANNDVVRDISFECKQGSITALVGPSGSGKSTLANLIPRFYDVRKGRISIGGIDIKQIGSEHLLGNMSLVFQDVVLLNDTVMENIRITKPDATEEEVQNAAKAAYIHEVIEQLPKGYNTVLGAKNSGLSGGERQRLTIARAILSNAPIVVLDEATASLDPDSEVLVQRALNTLTKHRTVIMIAHRLYTIRNADQIVVLDKGEVVEKGTHQELIKNEALYYKMWRAQSSH
ncbi:ABC transporter ATP-binding protein [Arenibacter sp. M-2]|uniref:ABC transporter ATP-binding protein n=1 Tax=Arenibacter sp. M-2 TaxID=3053612 RepID=UPI00257059F4|nr:ABC transporter ATP-binding protein [Arenibacter sp. M-2]MDL5511101.1 ABC transporter ATP-binding protein [Arenibacter sp. M-2]